jgi:hypothetical protein
LDNTRTPNLRLGVLVAAAGEALFSGVEPYLLTANSSYLKRLFFTIINELSDDQSQ